MVARVKEPRLIEELLLDQSGGSEAAENIRAARPVGGSTATGATEGLLADKGSGSLTV